LNLYKRLTNIRNSIPPQILHFGNYFGTNIATKAISFISIPIFTRVLSIGDYGIINLFSTYLGILAILLTLNLHTAIGRFYYDKENDEEFREFVGTTVAVTLIILLISTLIFITFSDFFSSLFQLPILLVLLIPIILVIQTTGSIFNQILQPMYQSKKIARLAIASSYLAFAIAVVLVFMLRKEKYMAQVYSQLIVGLVFMFYYFKGIRPYFKLVIKWNHLMYMIKYGVPMIPYALSGVILAQIDRVMINSYEGKDSVGMYSFAYNIAMLMSLFVTAIYQTWIPKYFEYMKEKNYAKHDSEVDKLNRIIIVAAICLILFGRELGLLLAPGKFHSSLNIIPIVVVGYVFESIFMIYGRNIGYSKKTIYHTIVALCAGLFNIWLNVLFIPVYGYQVAALTTLASYAFMTLLAWLVNTFIIKLYAPSIITMLKPAGFLIPIIYLNSVLNNNIQNIFLAGALKLALIIISFCVIFRVTNRKQFAILIKGT